MEWYDYVRVVNAAVALLAMYLLGQSWRRRNKDYSDRLKDFWWSLNALLFCVFMGNIEQIIRDREESWTLFVVLVAALVATKASLNKERVLLRSDSNLNQ